MKIITKHILRSFINPFITSSFVFLTLFYLSETFRIINIPDKSSGFLLFLPFYLLFQTPFWMTQILPISMLLAFLFSYGTLVRHNEITAIKAGGINLLYVFKPLIILSLLISVGVIISNDTIIPFAAKKSDFYYRKRILKNIKKEKIKKVESKVYKNIIYIGEKGRKYTIKRYDTLTNELEHISIDRFNDNLFLIDQIYAKKALWQNNSWIFFNGVYRKFNTRTKEVELENVFQERRFDLSEVPSDFAIEKRNVDNMTVKELLRYIKKLRRNSIPTHKESTQLHLKFSFSFAATIVILIGIAFASFNMRTAKILCFAISLVVSFLYWGLVSISLALGENKILPPLIAAWLPNFIFILLSIYFIRKVKK